MKEELLTILEKHKAFYSNSSWSFSHLRKKEARLSSSFFLWLPKQRVYQPLASTPNFQGKCGLFAPCRLVFCDCHRRKTPTVEATLDEYVNLGKRQVALKFAEYGDNFYHFEPWEL